MKYYIALLCIVCAIALPSPGHTADPGNIYLRFLEGDVQVKTEDAKEWLPASINMPLTDNDQIWVPDNGRAELFLKNGTVVRFDRDTYLEILASGDKPARFYLGTGRVYGNVIVGKGNTVVFETPTASFSAYARSVFRIDVPENEDSIASVFQGELYADLGKGQMKISAGERIVLGKNAQYPVLAKLVAADEWEQWNKQRDREFSTPESGNATAYLPDELRSYSYDLGRNGQWVYEQEYGYVWTPTVVVVQNWSPYKVGRWVWMRGNYVWISYEPWGWAPYHYGRWAFINKRGWCWVPPRRGFAYWGPGYVGWVYTPTYVSWVPLAPGEIYYGHGSYGPHSVNVKNVTIQNITMSRTVYKNVHVDHAVTTLHRDTFITGRPVKMTTNENIFLKEKRIMGAPEIKPEKATFMPVIKDIPQANRPPSRIANQEMKTFRKDNPATQIRNRTNTTAKPSGTASQIGQMNGKKVDAPQQKNNIPSGMRQERPATGNQPMQRISQVTPEERTRRLAELRNRKQVRNTVKETPPATGQPASARTTRTESQKSDTGNKSSPVPATRQQLTMNAEQQRVPGAAKQVQSSVPARFADMSTRKTGVAKNTSQISARQQQVRPSSPQIKVQAPTVAPQRVQAPPATSQRAQQKSATSMRVQTSPATSRTLPAAGSPAVTPKTQPATKARSVAPQTQPPAKAPSVTVQAQSPKKESMQAYAANRDVPSREAAPRMERKGGR
ncbi:MAG: FecR domain-containing protein [Syntrophorhabdaceae bacterium]|nr:FecR domain-containing protein [Syntrophorhabdaceae bacterium]